MSAIDVRYARSGDLHIAYAVSGEQRPHGVDAVRMGAYFSNLELDSEWPAMEAFDRGLAALGRVIRFDPRGSGMSDRLRGTRLPTLEDRMDDLTAVLDGAGSRRAALVAFADSGPMAMLFAATHPERTLALCLMNTGPRTTRAPDYPWGMSDEEVEAEFRHIEERWGTRAFAEEIVRSSFPSRVGDEAWVDFWVTRMRRSAAPGDAAALFRMFAELDVRDVLPSIHVPTLVLTREARMAEMGRAVADAIPGARLATVPGPDPTVMGSHADRYLEEAVRFLEEIREREVVLDRVLATVMFTDIVDSTRRAAELGDRRWAELVEAHHGRIRGQLARYRGREIDVAGDGFLAAFDGPARAIRCAQDAIATVRSLGLDIRVGVHTGECEAIDDRLRGIAVHVGARIAALAAPGEVLVSSTVKDLVTGSGLVFEDRGEHELKGVPDRWRLFGVAG